MKPAVCKACGAPIIWAESDKTGKSMPVDFEPTEDGNVQLIQRPPLRPIAIVHGQRPLGVDDLRLSHFVTCPQADSFRRSR